jgi:hypothetical protein
MSTSHGDTGEIKQVELRRTCNFDADQQAKYDLKAALNKNMLMLKLGIILRLSPMMGHNCGNWI